MYELEEEALVGVWVAVVPRSSGRLMAELRHQL